MKSQSLKLFAMGLILGLAVVFGAASANAQATLKFETPFDFHVGKDKLAAGKYELRKMNYGRYLLRNAENGEARIVAFDFAAKAAREEKTERIVFNRYGETYFLNSVFDSRDSDGNQLGESGYERQIRKNNAKEDRLAEGKAKPEKVSVELAK